MIKNMWVWTLKEDTNKFVKFCKKEEINHVFISNKNATLIRDIKKAGIKVDYLLGLSYPFNANEILIQCKEAIKLGYDGIHLDLEGNNDYLNYQIIEAINNLKFVIGEIPDFDVSCGNLSEEYIYAINKCNEAYLMNYRKTAIGMFLFAWKILRKIKIPFYIGFETGDTKEIENISYWKLGKNELNKQIKIANWLFKLLYKNYRGISLHYYDTYQKLH